MNGMLFSNSYHNLNLPVVTTITYNYKYLLCRLCLGNNGTLCDLYSSQVEHGLTVASVISDLLQCNVSNSDGYPQLVCLECLGKLCDFKKFKDRCHNAKSKFELDLRCSTMLQYVQKPDKKTDNQNTTSVECSDSLVQNVKKQSSDAYMKQNVEENKFTSEYEIKEEVDQDDKQISSFESSDCNLQNIQVSNPHMKQHVEERQFKSEPEIKVEVDQAFNTQQKESTVRDPLKLEPLCSDRWQNIRPNPFTKKATINNLIKKENIQKTWYRFGNVNEDVQASENPVTCLKPPSHPSCITERNGEHKKCNDEENLFQKIKVMMHEKKEEKGYLCETCGKYYTNSTSFASHLKTHWEVKPFVCNFCKKGFVQKFKLKIHINVNHRERKYKCSLCDRKFVSKSSVASHLRTHRENRPFQCKWCRCGFYNKKALKKHAVRHATEVPSQCDHCGKVFRNKRKILFHIQRCHMTKLHACSVCNKRFSLRCEVRVHMTLHTGEKNYMCEMCGKTFRSQSYLKVHRRVHTGEKPYHCDLCNKRFTQKGSITAHMKLHFK